MNSVLKNVCKLKVPLKIVEHPRTPRKSCRTEGLPAVFPRHNTNFKNSRSFCSTSHQHAKSSSTALPTYPKFSCNFRRNITQKSKSTGYGRSGPREEKDKKKDEVAEEQCMHPKNDKRDKKFSSEKGLKFTIQLNELMNNINKRDNLIKLHGMNKINNFSVKPSACRVCSERKKILVTPSGTCQPKRYVSSSAKKGQFPLRLNKKKVRKNVSYKNRTPSVTRYAIQEKYCRGGNKDKEPIKLPLYSLVKADNFGSKKNLRYRITTSEVLLGDFPFKPRPLPTPVLDRNLSRSKTGAFGKNSLFDQTEEDKVTQKISEYKENVEKIKKKQILQTISDILIPFAEKEGNQYEEMRKALVRLQKELETYLKEIQSPSSNLNGSESDVFKFIANLNQLTKNRKELERSLSKDNLVGNSCSNSAIGTESIDNNNNNSHRSFADISARKISGNRYTTDGPEFQEFPMAIMVQDTKKLPEFEYKPQTSAGIGSSEKNFASVFPPKAEERYMNRRTFASDTKSNNSEKQVSVNNDRQNDISYNKGCESDGDCFKYFQSKSIPSSNMYQKEQFAVPEPQFPSQSQKIESASVTHSTSEVSGTKSETSANKPFISTPRKEKEITRLVTIRYLNKSGVETLKKLEVQQPKQVEATLPFTDKIESSQTQSKLDVEMKVYTTDPKKPFLDENEAKFNVANQPKNQHIEAKQSAKSTWKPTNLNKTKSVPQMKSPSISSGQTVDKLGSDKSKPTSLLDNCRGLLENILQQLKGPQKRSVTSSHSSFETQSTPPTVRMCDYFSTKTSSTKRKSFREKYPWNFGEVELEENKNSCYLTSISYSKANKVDIAEPELPKLLGNVPGTSRSCGKESETAKVLCGKKLEVSKDVCGKKPESPKSSNKKPVHPEICAKKTEPSKECGQKPEPDKVCGTKPEPDKLCGTESEPDKVCGKKLEPPNLCDKKSEPERLYNKEPELPKICNKKTIPPEILCQKAPEPVACVIKPEPPKEVCEKKPENHRKVCEKKVVTLKKNPEPPKKVYDKKPEPPCEKKSEPSETVDGKKLGGTTKVYRSKLQESKMPKKPKTLISGKWKVKPKEETQNRKPGRPKLKLCQTISRVQRKTLDENKLRDLKGSCDKKPNASEEPGCCSKQPLSKSEKCRQQRLAMKKKKSERLVCTTSKPKENTSQESICKEKPKEPICNFCPKPQESICKDDKPKEPICNFCPTPKESICKEEKPKEPICNFCPKPQESKGKEEKPKEPVCHFCPTKPQLTTEGEKENKCNISAISEKSDNKPEKKDSCEMKVNKIVEELNDSRDKSSICFTPEIIKKNKDLNVQASRKPTDHGNKEQTKCGKEASKCPTPKRSEKCEDNLKNKEIKYESKESKCPIPKGYVKCEKNLENKQRKCENNEDKQSETCGNIENKKCAILKKSEKCDKLVEEFSNKSNTERKKESKRNISAITKKSDNKPENRDSCGMKVKKCLENLKDSCAKKSMCFTPEVIKKAKDIVAQASRRPIEYGNEEENKCRIEESEKCENNSEKKELKCQKKESKCQTPKRSERCENILEKKETKCKKEESKCQTPKQSEKNLEKKQGKCPEPKQSETCGNEEKKKCATPKKSDKCDKLVEEFSNESTTGLSKETKPKVQSTKLGHHEETNITNLPKVITCADERIAPNFPKFSETQDPISESENRLYQPDNSNAAVYINIIIGPQDTPNEETKDKSRNSSAISETTSKTVVTNLSKNFTPQRNINSDKTSFISTAKKTINLSNISKIQEDAAIPNISEAPYQTTTSQLPNASVPQDGLNLSPISKLKDHLNSSDISETTCQKNITNNLSKDLTPEDKIHLDKTSLTSRTTDTIKASKICKTQEAASEPQVHTKASKLFNKSEPQDALKLSTISISKDRKKSTIILETTCLINGANKSEDLTPRDHINLEKTLTISMSKRSEPQDPRKTPKSQEFICKIATSSENLSAKLRTLKCKLTKDEFGREMFVYKDEENGSTVTISTSSAETPMQHSSNRGFRHPGFVTDSKNKLFKNIRITREMLESDKKQMEGIIASFKEEDCDPETRERVFRIYNITKKLLNRYYELERDKTNVEMSAVFDYKDIVLRQQIIQRCDNKDIMERLLNTKK